MFFMAGSPEKKFALKFPLCSEFIRSHGLDMLLKEFFKFLDKEDLSPFERWWPLFIKDNQNKRWTDNKDVDTLFEIAQVEFYKIWALEIDLGANVSKDLIQINSSFQTVFIDRSTKEVGLERGLYGIYKNPRQEDPHAEVVLLSEADALMIDALSEDRKFTEVQLEEWMKHSHNDFKFTTKSPSWKLVLTDLISKGILIQSIHSFYS